MENQPTSNRPEIATQPKEAVDNLYDLIDETRIAIEQGLYNADDLARDAHYRARGWGLPSPEIERLATEEVNDIRKQHQENTI